MRPTVKLRRSLFKNTDHVVIRIRLLWKEILVFHGLVPGLGDTVGNDHFDLADDSSWVKHGSRVTPVDSPDEPRARDRRGEEGTRLLAFLLFPLPAFIAGSPSPQEPAA